jgi:hypothetical protein
MTRIISDIIYHFEWRHTNIPIPLLTDATLYVLKKGFFYIHGRAKDLSPLVVLDFFKLSELLRNK